MQTRVTGQFVDGAQGRILLVCHWPASAATRAVIVLPPLAEEMNKARRLLWAVGQALAAHGIMTVIPDLYGTGDSEGDFADAAWDGWVNHIRYDVGVGEALPYEDGSFDAVVCVDVLEHVADLAQVVGEIARVLKAGGMFCFDTINRNWLAAFVVVTMAEDVLRLLPRGTHDPAMFIRPEELLARLRDASLVPGEITGFGPRGINGRGDPTFRRLPFTGIIYMGSARKPA